MRRNGTKFSIQRVMRPIGQFLGLILLFSTPGLVTESDLRAQAPVYYDDVLLIINSASDSSVIIGEYFADARGIPEERILRVEAPVNETINDTQFEELRADIEAGITARNLTDSINYLVTTKGFPLRVNRPTGDTSNAVIAARRASVESELMLILGPLADSIGNTSWFFHSYGLNNADRPFRRANEGFYLVTRLDAYTVDDVKRMIDNGGPNRLIDKDSVLFVLDREPGARDAAFDQSQVVAAQTLAARGWPVLLNSDTVYVTEQQNVLGYASWGSNDRFHRPFAENARTNNTWSPGALAETFVSTSGRSFQPGTSYGQSLIADWIAEGVAGAKGYVFEPFTIALALPHVYLGRYTDETVDRAYNMAESFAMASRTLSWMEVVLGDPKTSIITEIPAPPSVDLPDTLVICTGESSTLRSGEETRGIHAWFFGDTTTVLAAGERYDATHPLFLGEGRELGITSEVAPEGTYTFVLTNISGIAYDQIELVHHPAPAPDFTWEGEQVEPNRPVQFTDLTEQEGTRTWDFGDGSDPVVETDPVHTFPRNGTFFVRLTVDNGGCSVTKTIPVQVRSTGSISEQRREPDFAVTPVPAHNQITVREIPHHYRNGMIRLLNAGGETLQTLQLDGTNGRDITISLADLSSGVYFLEIHAEDGTLLPPLRRTVPIL